MTACEGGLRMPFMPQSQRDPFAIGLSEAEKDDLEKMLAEFRKRDRPAAVDEDRSPLPDQLDHLHRKLADLTEMVLHLDRRLEPLADIMRLSHQKSELLNSRLDAVIDALKKGRQL